MKGKQTVKVWDAVKFSAWLRRFKDAEGFGWQDVAEQGPLHVSSVMKFARGEEGHNPTVSSVVLLANGLGLHLDYVLAKAGVLPSHGRWSSFTKQEKMLLRLAISTYLHINGDQPALAGLAAELNDSLQEDI